MAALIIPIVASVLGIGTAAANIHGANQAVLKATPRMDIDVHFYINHNDKITIIFKTPSLTYTLSNGKGGSALPTLTIGDKTIMTYPELWGHFSVPVSGSILDMTSPHKEFSFTVIRNGVEIVRKYQDINIFRGTFGAGNMTSSDVQKTVFDAGTIVNFSFYEAEKTRLTPSFLPTNHQLTVSVAPDRSQWMKVQLNRDYARFSKMKLTRFALPSPHNFGMYDMANVMKVFDGTHSFSDIQREGADIVSLFIAIERVFGRDRALWAVKSTSFNQKDDVTAQLRMGARHFEVRASNPSPTWIERYGLDDDCYFWHSIFPGIKVREFVESVANFLVAPGNEKEFVVIWWSWTGYTEKVGPVQANLNGVQNMFFNAFNNVASKAPLAIGWMSEAQTLSIEQLLSQNKRVILTFKDNVGNLRWPLTAPATSTNPNNPLLEVTPPYDIFDSNHHNTFDGTSILNEIMTMKPELQVGHTWTRIQVQATVTEDATVRAAMFSADSSNYFLLAVKGYVDCKILPWLQKNIHTQLGRTDQFLVIMNDFFDVGTGDVANWITIDRFNAA